MTLASQPAPDLAMLTPRTRPAFLKALDAWSRQHGRQLPWRRCGDPYRVWISEVMLQQTTVTAVIPYFERFLGEFPTVAALAAAEEAAVLRQWEGLGYYSRARNLHAAARRIVQEFSGEMPRDVTVLQSLPGVGRYTAGAIASFAFDEPAPIVEANTQRLYARLLGEDRDLKSTPVQRRLWSLADFLVATPAQTAKSASVAKLLPGDINQALMDLGATICTPVAPLCPRCPVRSWCRAFVENRQTEIPKLPERPQITELRDVSVAVCRDGRYLLRQREPGERWAGLWDFPRSTIPADADWTTVICEHVADQTGLQIVVGERLTSLRHSVTRYRIQLECHLAEVASGGLREQPGLRWVSPADFDSYPLSVTARKLAHRIIELTSASDSDGQGLLKF